MRKRAAQSIHYWRDGGSPKRLAYYIGVGVKAQTAVGYATVYPGSSESEWDYSDVIKEARVISWWGIRRDNMLL